MTETIGSREMTCWRALAAVLSVQEALGVPSRTIATAPTDPGLWVDPGADGRKVRSPAGELVVALVRGDDAAVADAAALVVAEASDAWTDVADEDAEDLVGAEWRRRRGDQDLAQALAETAVPSALDALGLASRGLDAIRRDLGSTAPKAEGALDALARGEPASLGATLMRRSLRLGGSGDRRQQQRVDLLWTFLVPVAHAGLARAPRGLVAPLAAACDLLERGWPPEAPARGTVEVATEAPALSAADLLWPLVRRAHQADWVSWRSDVPETMAVLAADARRLPELLIGVTELVLAARAVGLGDERRAEVRRTLAALVEKRLGRRARFVLDERQADRLTELTRGASEPVPSWLRESLHHAVSRSHRSLDVARRAALDELLAPER